MHSSIIITRNKSHGNNLNTSDWKITKDKCDSARAHGRHLVANGNPENKRKIYCASVHLKIIQIPISIMQKYSAFTLMRLQSPPENLRRYVRLCPVWRNKRQKSSKPDKSVSECENLR